MSCLFDWVRRRLPSRRNLSRRKNRGCALLSFLVRSLLIFASGILPPWSFLFSLPISPLKLSHPLVPSCQHLLNLQGIINLLSQNDASTRSISPSPTTRSDLLRRRERKKRKRRIIPRLDEGIQERGTSLGDGRTQGRSKVRALRSRLSLPCRRRIVDPS